MSSPAVGKKCFNPNVFFILLVDWVKSDWETILLWGRDIYTKINVNILENWPTLWKPKCSSKKWAAACFGSWCNFCQETFLPKSHFSVADIFNFTWMEPQRFWTLCFCILQDLTSSLFLVLLFLEHSIKDHYLINKAVK